MSVHNEDGTIGGSGDKMNYMCLVEWYLTVINGNKFKLDLHNFD